MTDETILFSSPDPKPWTPTPDGNRRRVVLHTEELMMVEFDFDKGGVGALHSHPHVQASYVAAGKFEVTIDGKTQTIEAGGAYLRSEERRVGKEWRSRRSAEHEK